MIIIGTPPSTLYLGCSKKKNKGMPLSFCSQTEILEKQKQNFHILIC